MIPITILLTAGIAAFAQSQSNSGNITGTVLDPSGATIGQAALTLTHPGKGFSRTTRTDSSGQFVIPIVPPGSYKMRVEAPGFTPKTLDGVEVRVGDIVSLQVELAIGDVNTEILVPAEPPPVETERTQQAYTIEESRIRNVPINRRNYLDLALLSPGVVETTSVVDENSFRPIAAPQSGLSFGGGNGRNNGFYIDGVENYNNSGGVRLSLTQEMVQEFQVNRNSYTAEFGNALGGVVNIVSRSGVNDWHGNLFGFLRHRSVQARNYFDPGKSAFTRVQAGATAGGRIKRDRTFLFVGFERLDRHETNIVPLLTDRSVLTRLTPSQQQLVDVLNATNNGGSARLLQQYLVPANNPKVVRLFNENSGVFPFGEDLTTLAFKIDHRFSDTHSVFFRANTTGNLQQNSTFGALEAYNRGRSLELFDGTAMVSDTYMLTPAWLMETRLMFNYNSFGVEPIEQLGPEYNITGFGFFNKQSFLPYFGIERHYQVIQNFTRATGAHTLKFGFDFNPMRNSFRSGTFFGGRFGFGEAVPLGTALTTATGDSTLTQSITSQLQAAGRPQLVANLNVPVSALQAFSIGIPTFYQQGFGNPNYVNFIKRLHFYVQDSWRVTRSLTLTLGARYDNEFHNEIVPADRNNIGPRFGFAWSRDQRLVVRGGYGLYYGQITSNIAGTADPLSGRYINQLFVPLAGVAGVNNTITGRPLTSTDIYQTLLRQGVLGTRTIAESDLAQFGVRLAPGLPLSVIFSVDPEFENPWAHQASLEVERAFGQWAVSVAYNFNRAAHIARTLGRNVRYSGQRLPDGRPTFVRIDPLILQRNAFESSANSFYHAGIVQISRRMTRGIMLSAHYTFSRAIDESTDFNSDYSPNDQLNARAERGLSAFHQAHRVVMNSVLQLRSWNLSPIVIYNSWRPFNVLTGTDLPSGGDGYVNPKRPAHLGRNMGRGPDFFTVDLRLSRRFAIAESRSLEFIAEGFNLLNRTNFRNVNNTVGDVPIISLPNPITANRFSPTTPLAYTSALNPRQFQFGLKFTY